MPACGCGNRTSTTARRGMASPDMFGRSWLLVPRPLPGRTLLCHREMDVVDPRSREFIVLPEPRELRLIPHWLLAAIGSPVDIWLSAKNARALFAAGNVLGHEGAAVEAHAVVDVRLPADGLLLDRFPADKEVEGRFAFEDRYESLLQLQRRGQAVVGAAFAAFYAILLPCDPFAEIAVGQRFQQPSASAVALGQLVVINQRMKAIAFAAVPDVPDEGPLMEQLAVLLEELIAQPVVE